MQEMQYDNIKVLIVDDEKDTIDFISYNLKQSGFQIYTANNGQDGIQKAMEIEPRIILLDVMMPGIDGIEVCEKLRTISALETTLIVFLTARGEDYSQIAGFEAGGDDYIKKPIRPKVLISRINALLKRIGSTNHSSSNTADEASTIIQKNDITIDKDRYVIIRDNEEYTLPKKEFDLLLLLASNPNKVFSREQIFSTVWGEDVVVSDRTIDVHIRKLREKLGNDIIHTIKGVGYKYVE